MRWVKKFAGRQTNWIMAGSLALLAGLVVARLGLTVPLWGVVLLGIFSIPLLIRHKFNLIIISVLCFSLGLWRGSVVFSEITPYKTASGQKVRLVVTAREDAAYGPNGQLSFTAGNVQFVEPIATNAAGMIRVKGYGELAIYRGDQIELTGKMYKTRGAAQASVSYAQLHRIGGHSTYLDEFRRRFTSGLQTALPEPNASFGMGLLVGQRNTLPDDITQSFKMVGLTHIIAVSGYNLTIILTAVRKKTSRWPKLASTMLAVGLMLAFIGLTGASASIVRAAVVSGLSLAAWYVGRTVRPLLLILLAAALTAGASPIYLWSDIGWYLSFLAFFGILVLAPQIFKRIWGERTVPILPAIAVETLCAEIMTIPLVMFIFGQVSLIGLVANVLVAAVIPLAMLLCFAAGMIGWFFPILVGWVSWPATTLLTYMLDTATALSRVPNVFLTNRYLSVIDMVLCYATLLAVVAILYRPKKLGWLHSLKDMKMGVS